MCGTQSNSSNSVMSIKTVLLEEPNKSKAAQLLLTGNNVNYKRRYWICWIQLFCNVSWEH